MSHKWYDIYDKKSFGGENEKRSCQNSNFCKSLAKTTTGDAAKVYFSFKKWVNNMEITPETLVKMSYNEEDKKILIEKLEK